MTEARKNMLVETADPANARSGYGTSRQLRDVPPAIVRYFRDNYPLLLSGTPRLSNTLHRYAGEAREEVLRLRNVADDELPRPLLREILSAVTGIPRPVTPAGATAIGPRHARVWWDADLLAWHGDLAGTMGMGLPALILRFYDMTGLSPESGEWNSHFDLPVKAEDEGRLVDFWSPDRVYSVEIGFFDPEGVFRPLARTNTVEIPRECRGDRQVGVASRTTLTSRNLPEPDERIQPDPEAQAWAARREDHPERDWLAELAVHMVYRAFLREGPRALHNAPLPHPRDAEELRREFSLRLSRGREERRGVGSSRRRLFLTRMLVPEWSPAQAVSGLRYPPVPVSFFQATMPENGEVS